MRAFIQMGRRCRRMDWTGCVTVQCTGWFWIGLDCAVFYVPGNTV